MSIRKRISIGLTAILAPIALYATLVYADVVKSPFRTESVTIGLSTTPADNVKLHRGASGLQLVPGSDTTADGSDASSTQALEVNTLSAENSLKADTLTDKAGTGAPDAENGIHLNGAVSLASYSNGSLAANGGEVMEISLALSTNGVIIFWSGSSISTIQGMCQFRVSTSTINTPMFEGTLVDCVTGVLTTGNCPTGGGTASKLNVSADHGTSKIYVKNCTGSGRAFNGFIIGN